MSDVGMSNAERKNESKSERWWAWKRWKDKTREMVPDRKTGCLQIPLHQIQAPVGIITVQAYAHMQRHTQMHSDNPSAPSKCCLIQPDLHSTEKANSLPLTVWKTERSSHKWQRSELHRFICVCLGGGRHARVHTLDSSCLYLRGDLFFFVLCVCVFTCIGDDNLLSGSPFTACQADSLVALLPVLGGAVIKPCLSGLFRGPCVSACVGETALCRAFFHVTN